MNHTLFRWGSALITALAIAGCGGGGGGTATTTTPTATSTVASAIAAAITTGTTVDPITGTAVPIATATNVSSAFTVLEAAGVVPVTVASPPVINFTVFDANGSIVKGLTTANVRVAMAKLVPGVGGEPDQWVSYVNRVKKATTGKALTSVQATTDPTTSVTAPTATSTYPVDCAASPATLTYNADGYYTYKFCTDVRLTRDAAGALVFDDTKVHRVVLQLSYTNAAGVVVKANPYYDFNMTSDPITLKATAKMAAKAQMRKVTDVNSCDSCHQDLSAHGGGRVDTQYCVMCHNPGTTDPVTGNVVTLSTMVHKIHAGKRLALGFRKGAAATAQIDPYQVASLKFDEVGFPQDLRNCSKCHSATNASTPQGDNWKTAASKQACLSCHTDKIGAFWETSHTVYAKSLVSATAVAADLTNPQCVSCHKAGSNISSEVVHWNQNEENATKYKMNFENATYDAATRQVTVKYFLSDPTNANKAYNLMTGCTNTGTVAVPVCANTATFGNLRFYLAYQNMAGQQTSAVTEFSSYNNGGSGVNAYAYKGTNDGNDHYTLTLPAIPADTATMIASGTARVVSIGQIKEAELETKSAAIPRAPVVPAAQVNVVVQNSHIDVALTGALQPRREVVSAAKCNACHGALGTTSGANTLSNAFHGGARDTVEACAVCHDANRSSSGNMMTNGDALYEPYQFKRMIHGIHGNSKRLTPFTHGNTVVGTFSKAGALTTTGSVFADVNRTQTGFVNPAVAAGTAIALGETFLTIDAILNNAAAAKGYTGTTRSATENYAAEVAWPGVGMNCNVCHVNNSYKTDKGTLGTVVMKPAAVAPATGLEADPNKWQVISPKAASCMACHDGVTKTTGIKVKDHVVQAGGSTYGTLTQSVIAGMPRETCDDCHASGGVKGVDIVHKQQ